MIHKNSLSCRMLPATLILSVALSACVSTSPAPVVDHSSGGGNAGVKPAQPTGPGFHTVKKGDTLYSLGLEYGQDYRDIAGWNYITDPSVISIGQVLRVLPPVDTAAAASGVTTAPVASGAVVETRPLDGGAPPLVVAPAASSNTASLKREPRVNKEPYSDALYASLQKPDTASGAPVTTVTPPATTPTPPASTTTASADGLSWAWPASGKVIGNFAQTKGLEIGGKAGDAILAAADGRVVYAGNGLKGYGNLVIIKHNASYMSVYANNQKILVKEQQDVKRGAKIAEMGKTDSDTVKLHFEVRKQGTPLEPLNYLPKK
ncbi:MAG: peptidoglycan DD-metalloendopeptidase family protein [Zoogloeaceae bacterium]|jgi:lipoprotein NlpD|nr:peptidoglycan DD-metalloendopeptidase family protein [Zoogloeaceae bacterium]